MKDLLAKVELITPAVGSSLWDDILARVAHATIEHPWNPPRWIVADGRHRRAAEIGLLRASGRPAIPTGGICTLASLSGDLLDWPVQNPLASPSSAALTLAQIFWDTPHDAYRQSADKPGFAQGFWSALLDAESRGHFPDESLPGAQGSRPPQEFIALQQALHDQFARIRLCTPGDFLRRAIKMLEDKSSDLRLPELIFIGPLLEVSPLDGLFLGALMERTVRLILALPAGLFLDELIPPRLASEWHGGVPGAGRALPQKIFFTRPRSPEHEFDDVFAILAGWVAEGKYHYRDLRIIHPWAAEELPRLFSAARRYRVPVRSSLPRPLHQFAGAILLSKILDLFASGWSRTHLLDLLHSRLLNAPLEEKSRLIAYILENSVPHSHPPWSGWIAAARQIGAAQLAQALEHLKELDGESHIRQTAASFAAWINKLMCFLRAGYFVETPEGDAAELAAEEDSGWKAIEALVRELSEDLTLMAARSHFIELLQRSIRVTTYAAGDHRGDAVEILPAQQEDHLPVPVVIFLSLHSRVPSLRRSSPFLQNEFGADYERQLRRFNLQIGNAQEVLLLSCPLFDDDGDELALSPFLTSFADLEAMKKQSAALLTQAESWRPHEVLKGEFADMRSDVALGQETRTVRPHSLQILSRLSRRWSPTRFERAIQCYYLHFAADILKLKPLADTLVEAVTPPLLGQIAHKALQRYVQAHHLNTPFDIAAWTRARLQEQTWRFEPHLEADRAAEELVRCLTQFVQLGWHQLADAFKPLPNLLEIRFGEKAGAPSDEDSSAAASYPALTVPSPLGELLLEGRIDRLDQSPDGRALVIEYKYKKAENESKEVFFQEVRQGYQPQLPIYWLAAQKLLGLKPAALVQIYLRSPEIRALKLPDVSLLHEHAKTEDLTPPEIEQMLSQVISLLNAKAAAVAAGVVTPRPRDFDACGPGSCAYADLCRFRGQPGD